MKKPWELTQSQPPLSQTYSTLSSPDTFLSLPTCDFLTTLLAFRCSYIEIAFSLAWNSFLSFLRGKTPLHLSRYNSNTTSSMQPSLILKSIVLFPWPFSFFFFWQYFFNISLFHFEVWLSPKRGLIFLFR